MQRLVADIMLAKLARWLRLAGISIEDTPYVEDNKIIGYVKRKKALLLTADEMLAGRAKKRKFNVLLIKEGNLEHQLAFVAHELDLDISRYPGRICPICNGRLKKTSKKSVEGKVQKTAYEQYSDFYTCSKCGRVYWYGTHWNAIGKRFEKAGSILARMRKKKKRG